MLRINHERLKKYINKNQYYLHTVVSIVVLFGSVFIFSYLFVDFEKNQQKICEIK